MAKIVAEWGLKGSVKALPLSVSVQLLQTGISVYLESSRGVVEKHEIVSIINRKNHILISFRNISTAEEAAHYRNCTINVPSEMLPSLTDGEFYYDQVIGLSVFTEHGKLLGTVTKIIETGSNDVYVVGNNEKEILIPAIRDVIQLIDPEKNMIIITTMAGLVD